MNNIVKSRIYIEAKVLEKGDLSHRARTNHSFFLSLLFVLTCIKSIVTDKINDCCDSCYNDNNIQTTNEVE
jgi:hypothetical protein